MGLKSAEEEVYLALDEGVLIDRGFAPYRMGQFNRRSSEDRHRNGSGFLGGCL